VVARNGRDQRWNLVIVLLLGLAPLLALAERGLSQYTTIHGLHAMTWISIGIFLLTPAFVVFYPSRR
jgi:hypothetical protein